MLIITICCGVIISAEIIFLFTTSIKDNIQNNKNNKSDKNIK